MRKFGTAAILCGGKSSRMGFDKCKLMLGGRLLIELIGEKLEEVFEEIILITNEKEKFKGIKYRVYEDIIPDSGPIGAIYSALKYATSQYVFITACDMPEVNVSFIRHMMKLIDIKNVEGTVAYKSKYIEPLYAFYSKDMIERIEDQIKKQNYKLLEVINNSTIYYIEEEEVRKHSINLEVFTNLNYETDLIELERILRGIEGNNEEHKNS